MWTIIVVLVAWVIAAPPVVPYCESKGYLDVGLYKYCKFTNSYWATSSYQQYALKMLNIALDRLKGKASQVEQLRNLLSLKIQRPDAPLMIHIAGDNGVGKSLTASLVSLAMSRFYKNSLCDEGDGLIRIAGTSYDGLDIFAARSSIMTLLKKHVASHPYGIVVVDDINQMSPALVRAISSLFGKGGDDSNDALTKDQVARLTIFITSDLGREGRTQGKMESEVHLIVEDELKHHYGQLDMAMFNTFVYMPLTSKAMEEIARDRLDDLNRTLPQVQKVTYDPLVPIFIAKLTEARERAVVLHENGRALDKTFEREVLGQISQYHGVQVSVHVALAGSEIVVSVTPIVED